MPVPDRVTSSGESGAFEGMRTIAVRAPVALGTKRLLKVHDDLGVSAAPLQVLEANGNSPGKNPVSTRLPRMAVALPVFVTVTVSGALCV